MSRGWEPREQRGGRDGGVGGGRGRGGQKAGWMGTADHPGQQGWEAVATASEARSCKSLNPKLRSLALVRGQWEAVEGF